MAPLPGGAGGGAGSYPPSPVPAPSGGGGGSKALIWLLVAVIVGGLAILVYLLVGDGDDEQAGPTTSTTESDPPESDPPDTDPPDTDPPDTDPPDTDPPDTDPPDTDPPDTDPPIDTEGESINVNDLGVGDCWDDPTDTSSGILEVELVDCDDPHDNEVYLLVNLNDGPYDAERVDIEADAACLDAFFGYVGQVYEDSALGYFTLTPTEAGWAEGDREVICSLYDFALKKLVGSMEGSGV